MTLRAATLSATASGGIALLVGCAPAGPGGAIVDPTDLDAARAAVLRFERDLTAQGAECLIAAALPEELARMAAAPDATFYEAAVAGIYDRPSVIPCLERRASA
ncbi:MAG: hypothetical protein ACU0BF_04090 [Paracoccaceae bacterium]